MTSSSLGGRAAALLAALGLVGSLLAVVAPTVLASGPDTVCTGGALCAGSVYYAPTGETITMNATTSGAGNAATGTWMDQGKGFTYQGKVTTLNVEVFGTVTTAAACGPLKGYFGVEFVQLVMGPNNSRSYLYPAFYGCPAAPQPGGGLVVSGSWYVFDND